jgi:hypothetical protein
VVASRRRDDAFASFQFGKISQTTPKFESADRCVVLVLEPHLGWDRVDLALQWQRASGTPASQYGALEARSSRQASVAYFF